MGIRRLFSLPASVTTILSDKASASYLDVTPKLWFPFDHQNRRHRDDCRRAGIDGQEIELHSQGLSCPARPKGPIRNRSAEGQAYSRTWRTFAAPTPWIAAALCRSGCGRRQPIGNNRGLPRRQRGRPSTRFRLSHALTL